MAISLKSKTILITGATDGLGKVLAKELAEQHANVIVHGRSPEKVEKLIGELKRIYANGTYSGIVCDFRNPEDVAQKFSEIKQLDILINNAGMWLEGDTTDAKPEKIIELVSVNLAAPLIVTRVLLPVLKKAKFAQIFNTVSIAGVEIPSGYFHTIYSATKFGLQGFTEALAKEYDNKNIRVMGYYPGGMETKLFAKAGIEYQPHEPWMFDPKESAEAIIFMLTRNEKVNIKRMDLINHLQQ